MKIFVQRLSGEEPIEIEVEPGLSVAGLSSKVQESDPWMPSSTVSLVFGERILEAGEKCLHDYGIKDGDTLVLIKQKRAKILTASYDTTAKIWSSATGECTQTFRGHTNGIMSAVFSADESSVLTASYDETAKIWSRATGECTQTFRGHTGWAMSAVFSE